MAQRMKPFFLTRDTGLRDTGLRDTGHCPKAPRLASRSLASFMLALVFISWVDLHSRHLVRNFQWECRLFVDSHVVVSDFGRQASHQEGFQLHCLVFNGRKALVIVQKQNLQQGQAEWHPQLGRNRVQRLGLVGFLQAINEPDGVVAHFGA